MTKEAVRLPITSTLEDLLEHSIELEKLLEELEAESPSWLAISDELNDVRQEIGWFIAHQYKQIQF